MAPKRSSARGRSVSPAPPAAAPSSTTTTSINTSSTTPAVTTAPQPAPQSTPAPAKSKHSSAPPSFQKIVSNVVDHYLRTTPQRTKLLDAFMAFLVAVGGLQFAYCILAGNYNQWTDGQFGRAFADYIVCSLILHFFCVNFIN
ncbi:epsilon subunit-like protein [Thermochaetoides thermophila DSM 1495]|uniref:Dolichyl-diphosphooligosaccharide--protein glycosyltransferase subunit OST2 n=1 Tax=Chaetomium thermophilum (strain DSM 1495 / CBS 144.50 / IMI 039719) TaxID=759272 RepID=G0SGS9_CHATD|nr:epsilon subunit-like protein [Thermochaetoides thermophila DSM 1495]EGS17418.1 epsilon subunit-like protein [Thermochaetoides thermophila DSM 1495]